MSKKNFFKQNFLDVFRGRLRFGQGILSEEGMRMKTAAPRISCAVLLIAAVVLSVFGVPASAGKPTVWVQVEFCTAAPDSEIELYLSGGACQVLHTDRTGNAKALLSPARYAAACGECVLEFELRNDGTLRLVTQAGRVEGCRLYFSKNFAE